MITACRVALAALAAGLRVAATTVASLSSVTAVTPCIEDYFVSLPSFDSAPCKESIRTFNLQLKAVQAAHRVPLKGP